VEIVDAGSFEDGQMKELRVGADKKKDNVLIVKY